MILMALKFFTQFFNFISKAFLSVLVFIAITEMGCSKKTADNAMASFPSTGTNGPGDIQPNASYLWVHHEPVLGALRYTHKKVASGTWPDQCKVDLDAPNAADRDIECITESTELDLVHMGINLKYNVPLHPKCPYTLTMAPYFFQYEPPREDGVHLAPAHIEVVKNEDTGTFTASGFYINGTTPNPYLVTNGAEFRCGFDYRSDGESEDSGPNCCKGTYTVRETAVSEGVTTIKVSEGNWGGNPSACLQGPAMELQLLNKYGFPMPTIWRGQGQIGGETFATPIDLFNNLKLQMLADSPTEPRNFGGFEIGSLLNKKLVTSRYLATYLPGAAPQAFSDILNYYDYPYPPGYDWINRQADPRYFTILCMDTAEEITARIKLSIREWNTYSALKLATEPTANEDDANGAETDFPDHPLHDFYDWEDTADLIDWQRNNLTTGYPGPSL